jgi:hypothetical protein
MEAADIDVKNFIKECDIFQKDSFTFKIKINMNEW